MLTQQFAIQPNTRIVRNAVKTKVSVTRKVNIFHSEYFAEIPYFFIYPMIFTAVTKFIRMRQYTGFINTVIHRLWKIAFIFKLNVLWIYRFTISPTKIPFTIKVNVGIPNSFCVAATDIPALGRTGIGNQMIKSGKVIAVSKV